MSLRKGSLEDYYNSPEKCPVPVGEIARCYKGVITPAVTDKLVLYINARKG